jgi:bifunctional N-acetylglucosamine-1-phosphate-uridyltransferase/glucosamine-1-phosphate-acetyltransferase GlmU-like protein
VIEDVGTSGPKRSGGAVTTSTAHELVIGAGTTVWEDVPPATLALNPKTQVARNGWKRPKKG